MGVLCGAQRARQLTWKETGRGAWRCCAANAPLLFYMSEVAISGEHSAGVARPNGRQVLIGGLALTLVLGLAAWLRWRYIAQVQPYPDEFVTLLAVRSILERGLPILPSGLFYEHGLLFSYLGAVSSALFGFSREAVRAASLICSLVSLGLTWWLGRRWFSAHTGWLAALMLATAPSAVLWGGRARMYTLLHIWVLLTCYWLFKGALGGRALWRWLAMLSFLAAALTQFVAVALLPPLALGALAIGWLATRRTGRPAWFARRAVLVEGLAWLAALAIAFLMKRLEQPQGSAPLAATGLIQGLAQVADIYTEVSGDLVSGWQALAQFYLAPEALWLAGLALLALLVALVRGRSRAAGGLSVRDAASGQPFGLAWLPTAWCAWLLAATTLEMMLVVSPQRRDEKYLFMLLPVLCLLAAEGAVCIVRAISRLVARLAGRQPLTFLPGALLTLAGLAGLAANWPANEALLARRGPDYDRAFGYVAENWRPGDAVLTGTPAAAGIYLGRNDYYAMQDNTGGYAYRILYRADGQAVDRWMGSPWLSNDEQLHAVLSGARRVWLVLERWGLTREYFPPLSMQRLLAMTDFVREDNGIIVLRSRPGARLIPEQPTQSLTADFGGQLRLSGYVLDPLPGGSSPALELVLYWQALRPLPYDYSVFVHLRDTAGQTLAQADHLPLAPVYPPTLWPVGELIRERSQLDLPTELAPGSYGLWVGVYRLDTLERLPVSDDRSGENAVYLGRVEIDEDQVAPVP